MTAAFFVLYFVVVFAIGAWSMRLNRDESDYWIAGGKLGWLLGGATIAATHVSAGSFIGTIGVIYTAGWSFAWIVLSIPLAYWFTAAVLAPRFTRTRELTISAFLESRYESLALPPDLARQLRLIKLSLNLPAPADPRTRSELTLSLIHI